MYYEPKKVEAISFRRTKRLGHLKAYADVRIGRIEIKNFTIVEISGGALRVYPPTSSWEDPRTHEKMYTPIVTLPRDISQQVELAVLDAWTKEMKNEDGSIQTV